MLRNAAAELTVRLIRWGIAEVAARLGYDEDVTPDMLADVEAAIEQEGTRTLAARLAAETATFQTLLEHHRRDADDEQIAAALARARAAMETAWIAWAAA